MSSEEKGSKSNEERQTEANYSFYLRRVCAHIMTRADSRANLSHQFDDPPRERGNHQTIKECAHRIDRVATCVKDFINEK